MRNEPETKPREWNDKITAIARASGFLRSNKIGFYKHYEKDIEVDLTASGDSEYAILWNITNQYLFLNP